MNMLKKLLSAHGNRQKAEQVSSRALCIMVGLALVVFALFYLVGYDTPYAFDPDYNAPLLTDVLLSFVYLMVAAAIVVAAVAVWVGYKLRNRQTIVNGIPTRRIAMGTAALLVVLLVVTFLTGSSAPISINGGTFSSTFWLKATDMFINTMLVLIAVAVVAVACSMMRLSRRRKK